MKLRKIISVVGARPQFIKYAPLSKELRKYYKEILLHTGQHYDKNMSQLFFDELKIPEPDYNLDIGSGSHGEQTGKMLINIEKVLIKENPDLVIVYGDTNSTVAGALSAVKLHIPVAHIEAGLRSFNKNMPEEHNRIITDHLSDLLFVPSKTGMDNLKIEGLSQKSYLVGDIMYDALLCNIMIAEKKSKILKKLDLIADNYYLCTVHRPSNTDDKNNLKNILQAISELDLTTILPIHPRTKKCINKYRLNYNKEKIIIIDPVGYLDVLMLTKYAKKILTDSGGLQKEAFYLKKEVIVLREESEWKELVENNTSKLAGANKEKIINYTLEKGKPKWNFFPYGKGNAAQKIINILRKK